MKRRLSRSQFASRGSSDPRSGLDLAIQTKQKSDLLRLTLLLLLTLALALAAPVGAQEPEPTPIVIDDGYGAPGRLFDIDIVLAFAQAILDFIGVNNLRDWVALAAGVAVTYAILAKGKTETQ